MSSALCAPAASTSSRCATRRVRAHRPAGRGVEALLADEDAATSFLAARRQVRKLFKALLPDPAAAAHQHTVAAIRVLAERLADLSRPPQPTSTRSPTPSTSCSTARSAPRST